MSGFWAQSSCFCVCVGLAHDAVSLVAQGKDRVTDAIQHTSATYYLVHKPITVA